MYPESGSVSGDSFGQIFTLSGAATSHAGTLWLALARTYLTICPPFNVCYVTEPLTPEVPGVVLTSPPITPPEASGVITSVSPSTAVANGQPLTVTVNASLNPAPFFGMKSLSWRRDGAFPANGSASGDLFGQSFTLPSDATTHGGTLWLTMTWSFMWSGPGCFLCFGTGQTPEFSGVLLSEPGDTTAPVLTLPGDLTTEATSAAGALLTFTTSGTDDVDGPVPVTCSPASGSTFPLGETTVSCSATDSAGNTAHGSFKVTVSDTTAPTIDIVSASPNILSPPNHKMVAVVISVGAHDAVDVNPASHIVSVSTNEPDGNGSGNTEPDWDIEQPLTVHLRAERSGNGTSRVYTITIESADFSGNTSTATVDVTVPHDSRP